MGEVVEMQQAAKLSRSWQAYAQRLEILYLVAEAHRQASEILLAAAEAECDRLRALL